MSRPLTVHDVVSRQVLGIDFEDRQLYFRSGVSVEEPSGKSWKKIDLPVRARRSSMCTHHSDVDESEKAADASHDANVPAISTPDGLKREEHCMNTDIQADGELSIANSLHAYDVTETSPSTSNAIESAFHIDDVMERALHAEDMDVMAGSFGRLSFSRNGSTSDFQQQQKVVDKSTDNTDLITPDSSNGGLAVHDDDVIASTGDGLNVTTQAESVGDGQAADDVNRAASEAEQPQLDARSENAGSASVKQTKLNKLRANFGNRFNLKGSIDKLKTKSAKELFSDLKSDVKEHKNNLVSQVKQAHTVLLGDKKLSTQETLAVSFQRSAPTDAADDQTGLTFSQLTPADEETAALSSAAAGDGGLARETTPTSPVRR